MHIVNRALSDELIVKQAGKQLARLQLSLRDRVVDRNAWLKRNDVAALALPSRKNRRRQFYNDERSGHKHANDEDDGDRDLRSARNVHAECRSAFNPHRPAARRTFPRYADCFTCGFRAAPCTIAVLIYRKHEKRARNRNYGRDSIAMDGFANAANHNRNARSCTPISLVIARETPKDSPKIALVQVFTGRPCG